MPVPKIAADLLTERGKVRSLTDDRLFTDPRDFDRCWRETLAAAEIADFRFHDLRHTAASYLAMHGATLAELAEVLGHKTLQMVKRYSHLTEQHKRSLVDRMAAGCLAMAKLSDAVREALMAAKGWMESTLRLFAPELPLASCLSSIANTLSIQMLGASNISDRRLRLSIAASWTLGGLIANQRAHEQSCKEAKALELLEQAAIELGLNRDYFISKIPEDDSIAGRFAQAADDHFGALIGKRGRASCNESATRAMHIRLIALAVPARFNARYAFVTDVANRIGIDVTRQYVRALLLKGRT